MKNLERLSVLVVEDEASPIAILRQVLKSIDPSIELAWVTSAEAAQAQLEKRPYTLVVADYTLAGPRNGLELWDFCQITYPNQAFMMLSGLEIEHFFKAVGAQRISPMYLQKPFHVGECRQMLTNLLETKI